MQRTFFFDRDGVINLDKHYLYQIEAFEFVPNVIAFMQFLIKNEFQLFIVTNQSGIGRGYYTEDQFNTLTAWLVAELATHGVKIQHVYHCPHAPETPCDCRKPKAGMFLQAQHAFEVDLKEAYMIGDKESDIEAGITAGLTKNILFSAQKDVVSQASFISHDFIEIEAWVNARLA